MSRMRDALGELAETLRRGMPSTVTVARAGALAAPEPPAVFFGERTLEPVVQGYGATVRVEVREAHLLERKVAERFERLVCAEDA